MLSISGYRIGELIHAGPKTRVFRARREGTDEAVVIKAYRHEYPTERELARFEVAFQIGKQLDGRGIIRHLALEKHRNALALVTEDYGAVSLDVLVKDEAMELRTALSLAIDMAGALAEVHARNVVHKDIKPGNIVMNPKTGVVKLIDFGMSSQLSREHAAVTAPRMLEGTLSYISPEQTGRMNCGVDYRTDFYSLGVTLYELLTRQLPFASSDPMEMVHCHLARQPTPLHHLKSNVPEALSRIVLKLMAKSPEQRYLSAFGLRKDLEYCLEQLDGTGKIQPFDLGQHDIPIRFQIPQKLYGREPETRELLEAFDRVAAGTGHELVLVSGYSGIGKSALVHELHKPIVEHRGCFCSGKFDQFRRDLPYRAIVDAFRDLLRQHLTENAEVVDRTAGELREALGGNGRVIADLVPELERILGPQPEVTVLGALEAQTRFNRTFQNFVRVFARRDYPLTVFLDDLQWADVPSLQLLEVLVSDVETEALFMVWAYRDNEVGDGHPLKETLQRLTASKVTTNAITLAPLDPPTLERLVADTLFCSVDASRDLATLVHARTQGNPFFVNEFLKTLHQDSLVRFDAHAGRWIWDLAGIQEARITNNVVDLMSAKLRKLPEATQKMVMLAAVVGSSFELQALSQASGKKKSDTARALDPALSEGLVVPLDTAYKYAPCEEGGNAQYRFLHDRVHQAAYAMLDDGAREELHERVGRMILERTPAESRDEHVIDIVNHLNSALARIKDGEGRQELVTLNLAAGRRAKASLAFAPARTYLRTALSLLPADAWESNAALALELHFELAHAESLNKDYAAMEEVAQLALGHTTDLLAQVPLRALRIQARVAQTQYRAAVDSALDLLAELGVRLPRNPSQARVVVGVLQTKFTVGRRKPADLENLPEMTDPRAKAAMEILLAVSAAAYIGAPTVFPLIIFKMVSLSIRHGNSGMTAYAYGLYGLILCGAVGDFDTGHEFGKLSLTLMERFKATALRPKITLVFNGFVRHWKEPLRDVPASLLDCYFDGLEQGDAEYAGFAGIFSFYYSFWAGRELKPLLERFGPHLREMRTLNQEPSLPVNACWEQFVRIFSDKENVVRRQTGPLFDSDEDVPKALEANNSRAVFYGLVTDGVISYMFGDHERAQRDFAEAEKHTLIGVYTVTVHAFYQALAACARVRAGGDRRNLKVVKRNLAKLKTWAKSCPANQAHKVALVEAERLHAVGRGEEADGLYQQAVDGARANGFINEEALACELFGGSLRDRGHAELGDHMLSRAAQLYARWGAAAKAADLRARKKDPASAPAALSQSRSHSHSHSISIDTDSTLDFTSIIKATRSLSSEIGLDKLLRHTLDIAIENAGAERGSLLLERDGELCLVAARTAEEDKATLLDAGSPEISTLPPSVVAYCRRTLENVVLNDATRSDLFGHDPYIVAQRPKSVLAFPMVNRGKSIGLFYLENNLSEGAFTPDRLEVLATISGQAAISIENAQLYRNLESALETQVRVAKAQARFVPNEFLQSLSRATITDVELGDNVQKEMSILFSDIRSFTTLFEGMAPTDYIPFLNTYLSYMEPAIIDAGGFVDAYIGDAIMALFDAPEKAVRAGIGMSQNLRVWNAKRRAEGKPAIEMGVGVNTGELTLGTIGGPMRIKCSVIGDSVNLAARIEGLTKEYHAFFLISGHTRDRLVDPEAFTVRLVAKATVKGKTVPVTLFEVLDAEPPEIGDKKRATLEEYNEGVSAFYEARFADASKAFEACLKKFPDDFAARRLLASAQQYRATPPPQGWTGVETMKHK